ncbi:MAG: hypothetical protein AAF289_15025, partial [Cyanobacteria bacterium P01_A01_bin.135]
MQHWRQRPGYLSKYGSEFESIHILIGRFLADRHSPTPLDEAELLTRNPKFDWGKGTPLEKVVDSPAALEALMLSPRLFRNAIAIVEPWEHVGHNQLGEQVRASENVAYLAQCIADCDSVLFPLWASGPLDLDKLVPMISAGLAVVVEGGDPSVRDPATFDGSKASHADMIAFTERLLLSRTPTSAPA